MFVPIPGISRLGIGGITAPFDVSLCEISTVAYGVPYGALGAGYPETLGYEEFEALYEASVVGYAEVTEGYADVSFAGVEYGA